MSGNIKKERITIEKEEIFDAFDNFDNLEVIEERLSAEEASNTDNEGGRGKEGGEDGEKKSFSKSIWSSLTGGGKASRFKA
jgi:hypothetical protein